MRGSGRHSGARGSRTRIGGFACALLLLLALPGAAGSEEIEISDFGALAEIQANETSGLVEIDWGFEDDFNPQITQFLFLSGEDPEPMELGLGPVQVTDTNSFFDESPDTAVVTYGGTGFGMQISLMLRGAPFEPEASDLVETILAWNGSDDTVYFNQVVVPSLWGDPEGDEIVYPTEIGDTNLVRIVDGLAVFEEVVTPAAALFPFPAIADNAFLLRWEIEPDGFLLISKDKSLRLVPEPGSAALAALGLLGLAILGRRRA